MRGLKTGITYIGAFMHAFFCWVLPNLLSALVGGTDASRSQWTATASAYCAVARLWLVETFEVETAVVPTFQGVMSQLSGFNFSLSGLKINPLAFLNPFGAYDPWKASRTAYDALVATYGHH